MKFNSAFKGLSFFLTKWTRETERYR